MAPKFVQLIFSRALTWHPSGQAYGVGYGPIPARPRTTRLYRSADGVDYRVLVPTLTAEPETGETTLRFLRNGTAVALVRRDGADAEARVGTARDDYTQWTFKGLGKRLGGPNFLELPDGRLIAGGRLYDGRTRMALCRLDPERGALTELLTLPSGGDTSYPGLVWRDGLLWVSYYSSHEGKSCIYLARVRILPAPESLSPRR